MTSIGYGCMADGCQKPVLWLLTNLSNGATFSSCDDDFVSFQLGLLAEQLGLDAGKLYDAVKRLSDKAVAQAAKDLAAAEAEADAAGIEVLAEPEPADHDPGPKVDDQGGQSELARIGEQP